MHTSTSAGFLPPAPPLSLQIKLLSTHVIARRTPAWAHLFTCPSPLQPTADPWRSSTPTLIPSVTRMHTSPLPCSSHLCPVQPSPAALPLLISSYNIPVPLLECCQAVKQNDAKQTRQTWKKKTKETNHDPWIMYKTFTETMLGSYDPLNDKKMVWISV